MESKKINQLATELTPALSDLTIIGDPTTGISKKITLSQMASLFTGTVEEYANLAAFPLVGTADTIYIALDTNVLYRWDTTLTSYVELSPNIVTSLVFSDANGFDGNISLVGSVATLTITTALTQGSVAFIGASGALSQDNANYFWDNTNKRLGINTNTPTTAIDAFGSGIIGRLNGTSTNNAFLGFASAGTNKWSIGNVQSDHRFRIYSEANAAELVSILQTGEFGIGIANPTTKLHIDGGASALIANLDANVSVAKSISFRSDNSARINLEVSGTESGSNAGANFFIRTYTDAGSLLETPFQITRSTGLTTVKNIAITGLTANYLPKSNGSSALTNSQIYDSGTYVGINNTNPQAMLDIYIGSIGTYFRGGSDNVARQLKISSSTTTNAGDTHTIDAQSGTGNLVFATTSVERMRINFSGNISISANSSAWDTIRPVEIGQGGNFIGGFIGGSALYAGTAAYYGSGSWKYASNGNAANLIDIGEGVFSFRNAVSGTTGNTISWVERMRIVPTGGVGIGTSSVSAHKLRVIDAGVAQGGRLFATDNNIYNSIEVYTAGADGYNAATTVMIMGRNTSTGRSINAGGTINASGTDYAEYMLKAIEDIIAKGDIIGINAEGKLTNIFEDSISFVVKSTDPSYVGGDSWANVDLIGKQPMKEENQTEEEFEKLKQEHQIKIEEARAKVDRIAFSGQVPCNVLNAKVGDYIIPIKQSNGKISGQAVANPTLEQYRISVGKVWKIMEDGRAWIAVKIG